MHKRASAKLLNEYERSWRHSPELKKALQACWEREREREHHKDTTGAAAARDLMKRSFVKVYYGLMALLKDLHSL